MLSSLFLKYSPILRFVVKEKSMEPFLHEGASLIVLKYFLTSPKVGDVVIFSHTTPPLIFVKRIIEIKNNKIWMEGDNKKVSIDSRKFGYVEAKRIVGKVILRI